MKNFLKIAIYAVFVLIFVGGLILSIIGITQFHYEEGTNARTTYNCDVKNIRVTTDIEVFNNDNYVGKIKGRLTMITDPLKLLDANDDMIGYAGDDYAFIAQDSHLIKIGKEFYSMRGKIRFAGDAYELYDDDENYIGSCEFNFLNTKGVVRNANGEVIANYKSKLFFHDYDVIIYDNCELDDNVVLLICGSYYSDQKFDAKGKSGSSNSNKD